LPLADAIAVKCGRAPPRAVDPDIMAKKTVKIEPRSKSGFHITSNDPNQKATAYDVYMMIKLIENPTPMYLKYK
jgi:hypothetical protein